MIHWNNLSATERQDLWRQERESLTQKSYTDMLAGLALFCAHMPLSTRTLDYYTPESWPTPWEILHYGLFCRSSISLLMYYTLTIIDPNINIALCLIDDNEDIYLVPIIDDRFVLAYTPGQVTLLENIKKSIQIQQTFQSAQIKTIA